MAEPPLGNCAHFHRGIDIVASYGDRHPGGRRWRRVRRLQPLRPPGNRAWIVIIAHAQDLQTWYAHMLPPHPGGIVRVRTVNKGQHIGYAGSTGNSTGSHLHWAVHLNDNWVNPRLFL